MIFYLARMSLPLLLLRWAEIFCLMERQERPRQGAGRSNAMSTSWLMHFRWFPSICLTLRKSV